MAYQGALYLLIRMARGGYTLGEAGLVAQTATAMFLETVNLTKFTVRTPTSFQLNPLLNQDLHV